MSHFKAQHARRVAQLTKKLHEALVAEDDGEYLARTGSLVRSKTLRSKKTRAAFSVILTAGDTCGQENDQVSTEKRFWTKSLVRHALQKLVQDYKVEIPQLPGFTWPDWFKSQTQIVHSLCKKAFRNRLSMSGASTDTMDTLDYDAKDRVSFFSSSSGGFFPTHIHIFRSCPQNQSRSLFFLFAIIVKPFFEVKTELKFQEGVRTHDLWFPCIPPQDVDMNAAAEDPAEDDRGEACPPPKEPWIAIYSKSNLQEKTCKQFKVDLSNSDSLHDGPWMNIY